MYAKINPDKESSSGPDLPFSLHRLSVSFYRVHHQSLNLSFWQALLMVQRDLGRTGLELLIYMGIVLCLIILKFRIVLQNIGHTGNDLGLMH